MASAAGSTAPVIARGATQGVAPLRAGQGTSFFLRRLHSFTGIVPVGAFLFEHILISNCHRHHRTGRLCAAGSFSGEPSAGIFPRAVRHLAAHRVPRALRLLHLVSRRREYGRVSLERQLDVHRAALDGRHRLRLHPLAHLHDALYRRRSACESQRLIRQGAGGGVSDGRSSCSMWSD